MFTLKERILNSLYYNYVRPRRLRKSLSYVNKLSGKTLLDVGYCDETAVDKILRKDFEYLGIDPNPRKKVEGMIEGSIEDFETNKKFDIVVALEILEHTKDPVVVIKKLLSFAKKYICISVPHEPLYTMMRFFVPVQDHYWTVHPNILEYYFGKPVYSRKLHGGRTYFAIYDIEEK